MTSSAVAKWVGKQNGDTGLAVFIIVRGLINSWQLQVYIAL